MQYWICVKAPNKEDFKLQMDDLADISQKAHDDMMKTQPQFWCRAFFQTDTQCELTDNNLCEAFNGRIMLARTKNIYSYLEDIRKLVMKRLQFNRDTTRKWVGDLGQRIRKKLHYNKEESWKCSVLWNGSFG